MLDVKNNFRGKYRDIKCRGCGLEDETQAHVLSQCPVLTDNGRTKVEMADYFCEDTERLKETSAKIVAIMEKVNESE